MERGEYSTCSACSISARTSSSASFSASSSMQFVEMQTRVHLLVMQNYIKNTGFLNHYAETLLAS